MLKSPFCVQSSMAVSRMWVEPKNTYLLLIFTTHSPYTEYATGGSLFKVVVFHKVTDTELGTSEPWRLGDTQGQVPERLLTKFIKDQYVTLLDMCFCLKTIYFIYMLVQEH